MLREAEEQLLRDYLKEKKGFTNANVEYFIREFNTLTEAEKSEVIYEAVGKEIYKTNPVDVLTFIEDPYFLGSVYDTVFKIWKDMIQEIYPAPFCKKYDQVILSCATRCFGKGTEILMYDGSIKKVEDIVVGDKVMGPDSKPRNVLSLARGRETLYKVTPKRGGNPFICNASHKLALKYMREKKGRKHYNEYLTMELKDYLNLTDYKKKHLRMYHSDAIEYPKKDLPIDPYIFGTYIGDGDKNRMRLSTVDNELVEAWREYCETLGEDYNFRVVNQGKNGNLLYAVTINKGRGVTNSDEIVKYIKQIYKDYGHKRIPLEYLTSTIEDRLQLLAGLIDTDGYKDSRGNSENYRNITTKYADLAEDYATIARSLGFKATVKERHKKLKYKNDEIYTSYDVNMTGDFSQVPCRLERKRSEKHEVSRDWSLVDFTVEELGEGDFYGFEVDVDHQFLLPDYLVVENSGKTYISTFVACYELYLLLNLINPLKTYSVSNLVFALVSKDNATAVSQLGGEVYRCLTQSPYFKDVVKEKLSFSKLDKDGVKVTDDIIFKAGSSISCIIGTNLYCGFLDEANAKPANVAAENLVENRLKLYQEMRDRRESSFSKAPKRTGMLMFTSSPTDEGDVLSEIIDDVKKQGIPGVLIRDNIARWEAREEDMDETFDFFLGSDTKDPCIVDETVELKPEELDRVIKVPAKADYYAQFSSDPYLAIQNIAGRRTMPEMALFNTVASFEKVFHKEQDIFKTDTPEISVDSFRTLEDFLREDKKNYFSHPNNPDCFRYIHLDIAEKKDKFGLASVYSDRIKFTSEEGHEIYRRMYFIDFCLGVHAKNKEAVDILKILEFVYSLREKGYPLKLCSTDSHQGELARQIIAKKGKVRTEYLSMEKDKGPYLNLKNIILSGCLEGYKNPTLMKELRGLRESQKKIEKGKGYTDDMSDALAGALWSCSQDRFYKKNNEAISEIISQTGNLMVGGNKGMSIRDMRGLANQINKGGNRLFKRTDLGFRYGR